MIGPGFASAVAARDGFTIGLVLGVVLLAGFSLGLWLA